MTIREQFAQAMIAQRAGQWDTARSLYRTILTMDPNHVDSLHMLGVISYRMGRADEAIGFIRTAITIAPQSAELHCNLANILAMVGELDEALLSCRKAIRLKPEYMEAHGNLGNILVQKGKLDEAIAAYRQAIELRPDHAPSYCNLGSALKRKGEVTESIAAHRQAIALKPDYPEALSNLGNALIAQGELDEGISAYRRAIELRPAYAEAHNNLASALKSTGKLDDAIAECRHAIDLRPDYHEAQSNLLYMLHLHPSYDAERLAVEHQHWGDRFAEEFAEATDVFSNPRDSMQRIRIGYVSPDFRDHPVGRFLMPILAHRNRQMFELVLYANVAAPDPITHRLRQLADAWVDISGLSDSNVVQTIRSHQIDILVDLAMHGESNRLAVFARKPAPVQVTYLAYCSTTGLKAIDYRLSDPYFDPGTVDRSVYSEETIILPNTYWCYEPHPHAVNVEPLPAATRGYITFGSLNSFGKVNAHVLQVWSAILSAVPAAHLLLHVPQGNHRDDILSQLAVEQADAERIHFVPFLPTRDYFELYNAIDIALDTFPYAGGTTTCDAIWMGVPVVTLTGATAVGRAGTSILSNLGLPELIASSPQAYVQVAVRLAQDLPALIQLRSTLRSRMQSSPLMNAPQFANEIESAYRKMWKRWCDAT